MKYLCRDWMKILLEKDTKLTDGVFGIEIETETKTLEDYPKGFIRPASSGDKWLTKLKNWTAIGDGSLRDFGIEYVLNGPLNFESTLDALAEFDHHLGGVKFIKDSPSTSVHVHLNVLNMTMTQLVNFVVLYSLFENLLIEFSGPTRRSNLFALPLRTCDKTLSGFIRAVVAFNAGACDAFPYSENEWKYSAINFCPIMKHGSIEIRSFRGTTDVNEIGSWIRILKKLYDISMISRPDYWLDRIRRDRMQLFRDVFGEYADVLSYPNIGEMINSNIVFPVLIVSSVKDWSKFEDSVSEICDLTVKRMPKKSTEGPWLADPFQLKSGHKVDYSAFETEMVEWRKMMIIELMKGE